MTSNRIRERFAASEVALGTLSLLPEPALAEIAGAAGADFFVIDMEHAAIDGQTISHMIRAAQSANVSPIVRIREVDEKTFLWVLDSGAEGLMVPLIEDRMTARRAYELSHYPPDGVRTICSASRAAAHGGYRSDMKPYLERSNANTILIGLLESPEAVEIAGEIAKEPLDIYIIGRGDLSLKMGFPYAPWHPSVVEVTKRALSDVMDAGRKGGVLAYDLEDAQQWIDFGCEFVIYSQPEMILSSHYAGAFSKIRNGA